ncbi:MAG: transcription elongation factor [Paludibaculum sp.]
MPAKRGAKTARKSRSPSSVAGEYVREEIEHVRKGEHGARSAKQIIAIGLSRARRAGVDIPLPPGQKAPKAAKGKPDPVRSKATQKALEREGTSAASHEALSRQTRSSARRRGPESLQKAAAKAVRTKGAAGRHQAAVKAAKTRARRTAKE